MRACELRLSARGPFCCPSCEEHRFDTCRVADIKGRALDARFHGDWSRKSQRDRATRPRKLRARQLWYQRGKMFTSSAAHDSLILQDSQCYLAKSLSIRK